MVAITVLLAATVFILANDIGDNVVPKAPTLTLLAERDISNTNVVVTHHFGDPLAGGSWKISVTAGEEGPPVYAVAGGASAWQAGQRMVFNSETCATTTLAPNPDGAPYDDADCSDIAAGTTYHVVVVHMPSSAVLLDANLDFF